MTKLVEQIQVVFFLLVQKIAQIGDLFLICVDVIISESIKTLVCIISLDKLSLTISKFCVLLGEQIFVILQLSNEFFLLMCVEQHLLVLWC